MSKNQQYAVREAYGEGENFNSLFHYDGDDVFMPLVATDHSPGPRSRWIHGEIEAMISYSTIGIRITAQ